MCCENSHPMKNCIYCRKDKSDAEFTLEHVIPQFLGGAYAPDSFKVREVCDRCNSNLGLFVDAGFEKDWLVSNRLREAAYAFFDPQNPSSLPLICMGNSVDLSPPQIQNDEVCESWLGPLGEQIFWIRPKDEQLYWYAGGNPRTAKETASRAYFLFSERTAKNPMVSWLTFKDSFENRRVKKILCGVAEGADPADIGFEKPDHLDQLRIDYFKTTCFESQHRQNHIAINTHSDFRFMAKLGLGIGYSLFGKKVLETTYAEELYKALWYREGADTPRINGTSALADTHDQMFKKLTGEMNAVTLTILPSTGGIAVNLNIGTNMNWTVMCASYENLSNKDLGNIKDGIAVVLYRHLQRGFALSLPEYIAHKCGNALHPELAKSSALAGQHADYFKNL